ncbi:MAG: hypothetical protein IPP87_23240 [Ideonella sp.]|nr:hypothetical protein [Ideonella sp.]
MATARPPPGGPEAGDTLPGGRRQRPGPTRLLRTRIRENARFTIFDIDPITAEAWGQALLDWAREQPRG